ncbi:MAG: biotin/lipoyl-binding protein [Ruminococcaceae bacterium]|nr:biotin/lipoyl-binding protein [Oscillospiraceae bacterium]
MRKFMINVNGKSYEVDVEEIGGAQAPVTYTAPAAPAASAAPAAPAPAAPAPAAPAPATPAPATPTAPAGAQGSITITAPMPGTILRINTKAGDNVKAGDAVVVLEAMKMENEIVAPQDGTIASVNVSQGAAVNNGDVLVTMN